MSVSDYAERFQKLKVNQTPAGPSPHKPCMLLALIELAESGALAENRVRFGPGLLERYRTVFELVRRPTDHPNPHFPFFHLRGEKFWHLQAVPGREAILAAMKTASGRADIEQNIAYASLDEELHALLLASTAREQLTEALVSRWFPARRVPLMEMLGAEQESGKYERQLRGLIEGEDVREPRESYAEKARSSAFRRTVLDLYDYRCAASGWRIILPDGQAMAEAAHLIPFAESGDDDPRNGIALAPSYHWALDRHLIAPGPDLRWHVSKALDPRLPDNRVLLDLDGKQLLLPPTSRTRPREDALAYRIEHLRDS